MKFGDPKLFKLLHLNLTGIVWVSSSVYSAVISYFQLRANYCMAVAFSHNLIGLLWARAPPQASSTWVAPCTRWVALTAPWGCALWTRTTPPRTSGRAWPACRTGAARWAQRCSVGSSTPSAVSTEAQVWHVTIPIRSLGAGEMRLWKWWLVGLASRGSCCLMLANGSKGWVVINSNSAFCRFYGLISLSLLIVYK